MLDTLTRDRRAEPRFPYIRGCKLIDRATRRYMPASTVDVSEHGALLELLRGGRRLHEGDAVSVVIDWQGRGLLPVDAVRRGLVTRVRDVPGGGQAVAIRFQHPAELASEPVRAAA